MKNRFVESCRKSRHRNMKHVRSFGDASSLQVPKENFDALTHKFDRLSVERDGDTFFKMSRIFK